MHRMSNAEIMMIVLTAVLAATSVITVLIFNSQLGVMQTQVQDSRDALIVANRASVFLNRYDVSPVADKDGKIVGWEINPIFENAGNTPTKSMVIRINAQLTPEDPPADEFPPDRPETVDLQGSMIRPHGTLTAAGAVVSVEHIDEIVAKKQKFFIWGWVEYRDTFKGTPCHRTRFFNSLSIVADYRKPKATDGALPLRMPIVGKFNDPDDLCSHT